MADSRATVLRDAASYAADADLPSLEQLVATHQHWLRLEVVLRILLTYLPESVEPDLYLPLLRTLAAWDADPAHQSLGTGPPTPADDDERPQALHLLPISPVDAAGPELHDVFISFLVDRAYRIDAETGSLRHVCSLIQPFATRAPALKTWLGSTILPLVRLDYEFYPDLHPTYTLESFGRLRGRSGVYALLFELLRRNKETGGGAYGRDFRSILAPWIIGQAWLMGLDQQERDVEMDREGEESEEDRPLFTLWSDVFGALLDHAKEHHADVVALIQEWDGPDDLDWEELLATDKSLDPLPSSRRYLQLMLALLYVQQDGQGKLSAEQESLVLRRAATLFSIKLLVDPRSINLDSSADALCDEPMEPVVAVHLHQDELLETWNPLTESSPDAVQRAAFFVTSRALLASVEDPMSMQGVAALGLLGHAADQRARIQKILSGLTAQAATADSFWRDARRKLLWLRQWNISAGTPQDRLGIFGQIELREMEVAILKTFASTGRFKLLTELYINTDEHLPSKLVEQVLVETALTAYDNASNGNKTKGGMKRASDIIATFRHQFPESAKFQKAHALIQATHALSFYSLTLQHGTPFLPVNLRIHPNPLALFDKVLEQNAQSYTKLDDLIEIGKNFARAGLNLPQADDSDSTGSQDKALAQVERIVTAKAINASLAQGDFDTAYSYVVNRLYASANAGNESPTEEQDADLLWQAAYQAGRHQSSVTDGPSKLRRVEQRMELLSHAIRIAPPTALQEVLETWQSCEAEFNACRAEAAEEEEQWNSKADRTIPGGFTADSLPNPQKARESTRRAMQEEAPMGLFDVARGAAAAFSKSAFTPAQVERGAGSPRLPAPPGEEEEGPGRVRKRDMVSSAVTGGLVSGIGWMLGANPSSEQ